RPVAGKQGAGPGDPLALDHLQHAARARRVEIVGPDHPRVEYAAGPQVDLGLDRLIGPRRPPFLEMLDIGPRPPDEVAGRVENALQHEIMVTHSCSPWS